MNALWQGTEFFRVSLFYSYIFFLSCYYYFIIKFLPCHGKGTDLIALESVIAALFQQPHKTTGKWLFCTLNTREKKKKKGWVGRKKPQKCLIASDDQNCKGIQVHELWVDLEGFSTKTGKVDFPNHDSEQGARQGDVILYPECIPGFRINWSCWVKPFLSWMANEPSSGLIALVWCWFWTFDIVSSLWKDITGWHGWVKWGILYFNEADSSCLFLLLPNPVSHCMFTAKTILLLC